MTARNSFSGYWQVYGGLKNFVNSRYFWLSLFFTLVSYQYWSEKTNDGELAWISLTLGIMPNLLSFSLAGMAIMLSSPSGNYIKAIRQKGKEDSYLMKVVSSFFHFALISTSSILIAILAKTLNYKVVSFFGFLTTIYSVFLAISLVDVMWLTACIFNKVEDTD